jgi:Leu/Phe-tRNA-protein transferase
MMMLELPEIVGRYARGLFPMEDGWYAADPRAVFSLDPSSLVRVRRKLRRSLREG